MKPNQNSAFKVSWKSNGRTFKVLTANLIGIVFVSLLIYACSKEDSPLAVKSNTTATDDHKQTLDFIKKAKELKEQGSISLRTETYYNTADAIALLNDALNLNYCRPSTDYATMKVHKDTNNLVLTASNTISETNLMALYNNMAMTAGSHFYANANSSKETFAFDVQQANNLNGNTLPLYVYFFLTEGTCPAPSSYPYGADDDWWWAYDFGKCSNHLIEFDATDLLRCDLRKNKIYKPIKGSLYYYSNKYSICFSPKPNSCAAFKINPIESNLYVSDGDLINQNDITPHDNIKDYQLYRVQSNNQNYPHSCISDSEMNFYYEQMAGLCTSYKPINKIVGNIEVGYDALTLTNDYFFHSMRVDYWQINYIIGTTKVSLPCLEPPC